MLETFKERLKAKLKAAGVNLSTKRMDAIADRLHQKFPDITDEADYDQKLDDYYPVDDLKDMAKQDDKIRTLESKTKGTEKKDSEKKEGDNAPADDDTPAWAKSLIENTKALAAKVETFEKEKAQSTIQQKLQQHEKLKGVPKKILDLIPAPEKDDQIDEYADKVSAAWEEVKPAGIQTTKVAGGSSAASGAKPTKEEIDAILS